MCDHGTIRQAYMSIKTARKLTPILDICFGIFSKYDSSHDIDFVSTYYIIWLMMGDSSKIPSRPTKHIEAYWRLYSLSKQANNSNKITTMFR